MVAAILCLVSLFSCFGGWDLPLDPDGNAHAAMGTPADGNTASDPNACQPIADFFTTQMWTPLLSTTCMACHQDPSNPFHLTAGDAATSLTATEAEAKKTGANNTSLLLLKPSGQVTHGGGTLIPMTSATYMNFEAFVTAVQANAQCVTPP